MPGVRDPQAVTPSTGDARLPPAIDEATSYLVCIEGERSIAVPVPITGELLVGRSRVCSLRLADDLVSRVHARLISVADGIRIEDCGSRHGTLVNGQRLTASRLLGSGDVIGIGNVLLVVYRPIRAFRPIDDELRELERERMAAALAATGGVQNKAAKLIGMPLRTFVTKLKRYAIATSERR
jgi:pSer/pThr/pTyr-binding forkhead associated (FHA) protein